MIGKPAASGLTVCLLLLQGNLTLPAAAAEPPTSPDPTPNLKPADSSTPSIAARDSDDLRITAQIRQALLADKSFSLLAQRVQIATNQDAVILRGAVLSNELSRIEALAGQFAGSRQINNQLTVAAQ